MRARGLRPRGVRVHLAFTAHTVLPSARSDGVGTPDASGSRPRVYYFVAQYPARIFPCQRFTPALTSNGA